MTATLDKPGVSTAVPRVDLNVNEFGDPIHRLPGRLLHKPIMVDLVGCGGTGSQILTGLARLHLAMLSMGHPAGLHVMVYDPDTVSVSNVGRQLFYPADVGRQKSDVLVNRINLCFGLEWESVAGRYQVVGGRRDLFSAPDILITCVDTARTRREIGNAMEMMELPSPEYWLDCGNSQRSGQVYLSQPPTMTALLDCLGASGGDPSQFAYQPLPGRLPRLQDILPKIFDEGFVEDNKPSCSLAEALEEQDLFINQMMATWADHLLWTLFRRGCIEHHGYIINLEAGRVVPVRVPVHAKQVLRTENHPESACSVGGTNDTNG